MDGRLLRAKIGVLPSKVCDLRIKVGVFVRECYAYILGNDSLS